MKNYKLIGVRMTHEKGLDILETAMVDREVKCKECGQNPRKNGSARCEECSRKNKIYNFQKVKFQNKVDKQLQK